MQQVLISHWLFDTRNVTAMCQMFLEDVSFNQPLAFDISNATNIDGMIDGMFSGATSFNQSNWKPNAPAPLSRLVSPLKVLV